MASNSSPSSLSLATTSASEASSNQGQKRVLLTSAAGKAGKKGVQYVVVDANSVHSTTEATSAAAATASQVAASALQLLASASGEPQAKSARRDILVRQPSYCKILDDLKDAETMAKTEPSNAEVTTSGDAESSGNVQTISINGQQYQIVTPSALETSSASGSSSATAASVIQYAAASQNGQTVFIPGTVAAAGGSTSPQVITVTGSGGGAGASVEEQVRKREVRLMKNREAARECRNKKKEYIKCLENRVAVLENQNKALIEELKSLKELYTGQKS